MRLIVPTLPEIVPDVDALLNMDPEDLGIELLRVFDDPRNTINGMVHLGGFESDLMRAAFHPETGPLTDSQARTRWSATVAHTYLRVLSKAAETPMAIMLSR